MRVKSLLLVCTLALSAVAIGPASPASATHCRTSYLSGMPPPPPPEQVVIIDDSIRVDGNLAAAYALALVDHFAAETTAFLNCQIAEAGGVVNALLAAVACTTASPGVMNLTGKNPHWRYVTVSGLTVEVHHAVLLADARAVADCWVRVNDQ